MAFFRPNHRHRSGLQDESRSEISLACAWRAGRVARGHHGNSASCQMSIWWMCIEITLLPAKDGVIAPGDTMLFGRSFSRTWATPGSTVLRRSGDSFSGGRTEHGAKETMAQTRSMGAHS